MMMSKLQVILIVCSCLFSLVVLDLIRRETLELKYSLIWLVAGSSLIILALFPVTLDYLSLFLGVVRPINTLFLVGNLFLICIVFSLTVALSRNSNRVKELTQEVALLKLQIEEINNRGNSTGEKRISRE